MNSLEEMLLGYAPESGAISAPEVSLSDGEVVKTAGELLQEEAYCKHEETFSDKLDHASKAREIAEHLDELADRAEELADEDQAYARNAVSVEALHREFRGLMRAYRLNIAADSFEHAYGDVEQLRGLAKDARRTGDLVRGFNRTVMDYSSEGSIMKALFSGKSKLEKAQDALRRIQGSFKSRKAVVAQGVVIRNDGLALFLNQEGEPVTDLKKAVDRDAAWLAAAHDTVVAFSAEVARAAKALKDGSPATIPSFDTKKVATGLGKLLGNRTVSNDLDYRFEHKMLPNAKVATAAAAGIFGTLVAAEKAGTAIAIGVGGGTGLALTMLAGVSIGHLAGRAINAYNEYEHNKSDVQSIASADDLEQVIKTVLAFDKYIQFSLDLSAVEQAEKHLRGTDKVAAKKLDDAVSAAADLVEVIYEHAHFVTLNIAHLLELTVKKIEEK